MKGVPVKFRAKHIATGEYIYGDLIHDRHGETRITYESDIALTGYVNEAVKPDSVAQLVGYDADGKEIYEGDKLFDPEYNDFVTAEIFPCVRLHFYRKVDN